MIYSYLNWEVRNVEEQLVAKRIYPNPDLATSSAILDRIIKPGESLAGSQDISRLYDMSRPGEYVIQASRPTSDAKDAQIIKSNKVSVTKVGLTTSRVDCPWRITELARQIRH